MQNRLSELTFINYKRAIDKAYGFKFDEWADTVKAHYKDGAYDIIKRERELGFYLPETRIKRINAIKDNWPEIVKTIKRYIPPEKHIIHLIKSVNGMSSPDEAGISSETVLNGVLHAKEIRALCTVLQILADLDLLEEFAVNIVDCYS